MAVLTRPGELAIGAMLVMVLGLILFQWLSLIRKTTGARSSSSLKAVSISLTDIVEMATEKAHLFRFALPASKRALGMVTGDDVTLFYLDEGKKVISSSQKLLHSNLGDEYAEFIFKASEDMTDRGKMSKYLYRMKVGDTIGVMTHSTVDVNLDSSTPPSESAARDDGEVEVPSTVDGSPVVEDESNEGMTVTGGGATTGGGGPVKTVAVAARPSPADSTQRGDAVTRVVSKEKTASDLIKSSVALAYFRSMDLSILMPSIDAGVGYDRKGWGLSSMLCSWAPAPRLQFTDGQSDHELMFLIAKVGLDRDNITHVRVLSTIYMLLTGKSQAPALPGGEWEVIGFQGADPATDLRSTGMLSLLQMLWLCEQHPKFARRLLRLSHHPSRSWPLLCVSINFSLITLQVLRQAKLVHLANAQRSVLRATCLLHAGLFYSFYKALLNEPVREFHLLLGGVKSAGLNSGMDLVRAFQTALAKSELQGSKQLLAGVGSKKKQQQQQQQQQLPKQRKQQQQKQQQQRSSLAAEGSETTSDCGSESSVSGSGSGSSRSAGRQSTRVGGGE